MNQVKYEGKKQRLDIYISSLLDITRSQAQKKIKAGEVKIGGKLANPGKIVVHGDIITISKKNTDILAEGGTLCRVDVIYEDESIVVVDKQAGVVVYPAAGHKSGTLLDAIREKIKIKGGDRPGVVHRLDKDTSGLIVFAKNQKTLEYLQEQMKERKFEKVYLALVWGKVKPGKGTIDIPIKRAERDRKKMEAAHMGKESQTKYEVIKYYDKMTLLKVRIITGRTHQIRVHFAGIGYPVVGDKKYGSHPSSFPQRRESHSQLNRQFLHAHKLGFELFGKKYHFKSDLPDDLNEFIKNLE